MQQGIPKASTTQQFFPPKNSLQQLYWTKRSQEPFPCPPPKQKTKNKTTKKSQQTPHPPKKNMFFFYLSNWTLCVSQDVAAQAGNSALVSLAWSDHPAGEVGRFPTYHVFWEVDKLICFFFSWGWLVGNSTFMKPMGFWCGCHRFGWSFQSLWRVWISQNGAKLHDSSKKLWLFRSNMLHAFGPPFFGSSVDN